MDELALFLFTSATVFSLIIAILFLFVIYALCCGPRGIQLGDGLPGAFDDSEQFMEEEQDALEVMDDRSRQSYLMAKRWIEHNPPNSADTDISLSQYMTIQEKAVAAWEFTFDILHQPSVLVRNRTELEFRGSDDVCCVQTNLPLPKQKDVYYWEAKIFDIDPDTKLSIGLTTKPYPVFRLPGMHRYSVAYDSTGHRRLNQPFLCPEYGRKWQRGDVIGVGYRTRSGVIFFTHNGKKLDDVVRGMRLNVFPTVGATGPANVYVNLGQDGFVFIQANVREWGLAPAQGSLAPPPAYGDQEDSLLLESHNDPGPSTLDDRDVPPYVRRRSSDDAHASLSNQTIRTPPGSPPLLPSPPQQSEAQQSDSDEGEPAANSGTSFEGDAPSSRAEHRDQGSSDELESASRQSEADRDPQQTASSENSSTHTSHSIGSSSNAHPPIRDGVDESSSSGPDSADAPPTDTTPPQEDGVSKQ